MGRWWWLAAVLAALVGVWWWRRDKALKGEARTTPAPAGSTTAATVAALTAPPKAAAGLELLMPFAKLAEVGWGVTPPAQVMNASKPAPSTNGQLYVGSIVNGRRCVALSKSGGCVSWEPAYPQKVGDRSNGRRCVAVKSGACSDWRSM